MNLLACPLTSCDVFQFSSLFDRVNMVVIAALHNHHTDDDIVVFHVMFLRLLTRLVSSSSSVMTSLSQSQSEHDDENNDAVVGVGVARLFQDALNSGDERDFLKALCATVQKL
eukprot:PhM_4_TR18633/c0_g1_i2/m.80012